MWSVPIGDDGTHENTMTAHTDTDIEAVPDIEMNRLFQSAGVVLCSRNKIRSALNSPAKQEKSLREAEPREAKSKQLECLQCKRSTQAN